MSQQKNIECLLTQLIEDEKRDTCGEQSRRNYFDMHRARFADILRLCRKQVPNASARVLDIGRSELTAYLLNFYQDVHTLGLDVLADDGGHRESSEMENVPHIVFDLLNSPMVSSWPGCGHFDLIVFSEVLEHLSVAPEYVLAFLSSLLTDRGILVCTTPNAAEISKRLRLAFGKNPYERLRLYSVNPGHVREYTQQELYEIARSVGLRCIQHSYSNWFPKRNRNLLRTAAMKLLRTYPSFRSFQTLVLTKRNVFSIKH